MGFDLLKPVLMESLPESGVNVAYILQCADGSLYTGWTNHLSHRILAHNAGHGAKYTKPRRPVSLVHYEVFETKPEAMRRECEIKRMNRARKLELISAEDAVKMTEKRMDGRMIQISDTVLTHGGKFHADDVFSSALIKLLKSDVKIIRSFKVPEDFTGLVYDIGWGVFDHHQEGAEIRPNGVPYAAFGLLWREFGAELVGEEEAGRFDEHFVQSLDLDDNTGCGSDVASLIGLFNPAWDSDESADVCFAQAVDFALTILKKKIDSILSVGRARKLVEEALEQMQDKIMVLPLFAPWKAGATGSEAEFVIYPSQRGGYNAQAVPQDEDGHTLKCPFPEAWAGKTETELPALSGIETLRFCHNNRFLIAADTLDDAIKACRCARK